MWILPFVGYAGVILGFSFLTLAIASGLYYLSELVEEHTVLAKKLLTRLIYTIIVLQILLCVIDGFPKLLSLLSIASHIVYLQNLRRFPIVKLTDPFFLLSCGLVLLNHYLWFSHFQRPNHNQLHNHSGSYRDYHYRQSDEDQQHSTFSEIASYFGLCVWMVPFALFVALSASENVLPSMGSEYATGQGSSFISPGLEPATSSKSSKKAAGSAGGNATGMAKAVVNGVRDWVGQTGEIMGVWKAERDKSY